MSPVIYLLLLNGPLLVSFPLLRFSPETEKSDGPWGGLLDGAFGVENKLFTIEDYEFPKN